MMLPLNPLTMPLQGLQVIEASAGTGKTWTLAALYVRLVLGHGQVPGASSDVSRGLYPPQILVMTFTEAATAELRGRIRERLSQAAAYFKAGPQATHVQGKEVDAYLQNLRAEYPPAAWPDCAHRLEMSAQWMDDAAIFTIHGWSSRMLRQHAFDSASLFQQSRVEDSEQLRLQAVQDYWRHWFYGLDAEALKALNGIGATPDELLANLKPLWNKAERSPAEHLPAAEDPHAALQAFVQWKTALEALETTARSACTPATLELLDKTILAKALKGYRKDWVPDLALWAQATALDDLPKKEREKCLKALARFSLSTLLGKGWDAASSHAFFGYVQSYLDHLQAEPDIASCLLNHAAAEADKTYRQAKAQLAQFDFSDLLQNLYYALQAEGGRLAAAIRQQYPVALVDEFQDTDPWQYGALSRIYGQAQEPTGLIMIGDPKQAIYSFRGADLDTYLEARNHATAIHTIKGNFRSTPGLVSAVNHVFGSADKPFGDVAFEAVEALNPKVQPLQVEGQQQVAMTVWHHPFGKPANKEKYQSVMADIFATHMVKLLNAGAAKPGQMAVLVRSGRESEVIRQALQMRGVRSVYLSDRESVYASPEATDLWRFLSAVANPRSVSLVRASLATRLWGMPLDALDALMQDESAWDTLVEQFHQWQTIWQRQGLLPMLHHWLHDQAIARRMLAAQGVASHEGERRLTNLLHLGDLLQSASAGLQGEGALIRYLEQQCRKPKASGDTAQIRLESDADLVQVITMHKAKGLQYPLVFLPFVATYREDKDQDKDKDKAEGDADRLDEDIRLLYVALTRAERALWLGVGPVVGDLSGSTPKIRSALSLLLGRKTPDDLPERLEVWNQCKDIDVLTAPTPTDAVYQPAQVAKVWRPALLPTRSLQSHWWTASFSALTRDMGHGPANPPLVTSPSSDRDERLSDALIDSRTTAGTDTFAAERDHSVEHVPTVLPETNAYQQFPAGSQYGTLLHDLLEWQFERGWPLGTAATQGAGHNAQDTQETQDTQDWQALVARKAQRLKLSKAQADLLDPWLLRLITVPMGVPRAASAATAEPLQLQMLGRHNAWAEMSFTLPVQALSAARLDAQITQHVHTGQPRQPLQPLQLEGMLIGFMDLVLEHQGRYFVLDYKSNRLPAYTPETMLAAILEHRYDVQYTLYLLALHRLLKNRLSDYDYDQHIGGALYLFLRGVDSPSGGVFFDRPPKALIEALDQAMKGTP